MTTIVNQPETCYVILHLSHGPSQAEVKTGARVVVETGDPPFQLTDNIWMERFDKDLGEKIQTACDPSHYNISSAGYDRHLYAFVKRITEPEKSKYEGMSELAAVVALSRLVHPTSTGDRYCARIFRYGDKNSPIEAVRFFGVSADIALIDGRRDWLSVEDGRTLLKLAPWLQKTMHKRVHHAYWNHETALRSYYLDVKWTFMVSAFEALVNTREDFVRMQFRERVGQLASHFGVKVTEDELNNAYTLRSELVHSQKFLFDLHTVLPQSEHVPLYQKLESLLRRTLLECLLDPTFGDHFRDEASINVRWPVKFSQTRKRTGKSGP
jgi:hypothetical protein